MHLINGRSESKISILDRGVLYGHSVFETIAVDQKQALLLDAHLKRLERGCNRLGIPFQLDPLQDEIERLISAYHQDRFVLRLSLTMGEGGRGYLPEPECSGTRIVSAFPWPQFDLDNWKRGIKLGLVEIRLADQPELAGIKHANRLEQVIARSQWPGDCQEALLLDRADHVIEATQANIFFIVDDVLLTPNLEKQGVEGVMRENIMRLAKNEFGLECRVESVPLSIFDRAQSVFVCNSIIGLWPVACFQQHQFSEFEMVHQLLDAALSNEFIPSL